MTRTAIVTGGSAGIGEGIAQRLGADGIAVAILGRNGEAAEQTAAAVEADSEHPLARAIVTAAKDRGLAVPRASHFRSIAGRGVEADIHGQSVAVGGPTMIRERGWTIPDRLGRVTEQWAERGAAVLHVASDGQIIGALTLEDQIRPESRQAIAQLHDLQPVRLAQPEMHTDRVQWLTIAIQPDDCVEQAARFGLANRCIDIAPGGDRMSREQRIPVMPTRRNSIPAVGVLRPDAVRQHLVLMHVRLRTRNRTDFLKEDEVRPKGAQGIANPKQDAMPVSGTQALMSIQREHADPLLVTADCRFHAHTLYRVT